MQMDELAYVEAVAERSDTLRKARQQIAELKAAIEQMRAFAIYGCGTKQKDVRGRQFASIINIADKVRD
jgi:hypothetical protein